MSKQLIEDEWNDFSLKCLANITHQQFIDLRRTFFGGASALYHLMMTHLDSGDEPTEQDLQMMRDLRDEIRAFNDRVKAGEA